MIDRTTFALLLPEIVVIAGATTIYLAGAFFRTSKTAAWLAAGVVLLADAAALWQDIDINVFARVAAPWSSGPLTVDAFGHAVRLTVLLLGLLLIMTASGPQTERSAAEFHGSLLLVLAGLMLAATSNDLVMLFVSLELVSIPTYVLLYLGGRDAACQEATAKYFFLSILASALLLYGFSFLYGVAGTTQLSDLAGRLSDASSTQLSTDAAGRTVTAMRLAPLGLLFVFAGLGFRLAAVPFHFYAPDVYQGTSNPNAALLSTLPKIAGLVVLVRVVIAAMPGQEALAWKVTLVLAVLTMTLGNVLALWQNNIRRLLAYSSIAHGGYMLIGVTVGLGHLIGGPATLQLDGVGMALFYLLVYSISTIGVFAVLTHIARGDRQIDDVDELSGLGRSRPVLAIVLAIFVFSLAGIPPLAGFWGKLTLFTAALDVDVAQGAGGGGMRPWFIALAIIGVLNAAIAMAYYLRIVAVMYFRPSAGAARAEGGAGALWAAAACAILTLAAGVWPGPWIAAANDAGRSVRPPGSVEVQVRHARTEDAENSPLGVTQGSRPPN